MSGDFVPDAFRVAGALVLLLAPLALIVAWGWFVRFFRGL